MKTIHFNTGRKYSVHGQRITATLHDDGEVTFYDHDRMVDGHVGDPNKHRPDQVAEFTEARVRGWYDKGQYYGSTRSFADGLMGGGCNSKYEG